MPLPLPYREHDPGTASLVSTVFLPYPEGAALAPWSAAVAELRALLPGALLVTVRHPADEPPLDHAAVARHVDLVLRSFEEGLAFVAAGRLQK
jgi:hypothetical protein